MLFRSQVAIYREMLQVALRLNRVDDAVRYAQKAVSLNPDDYQLLRWLSRQMIRQQKLPQAIKLLEQARRSKAIDHKSVVFVNVMRDLGLIYMGTGKAQAAAECFEVVFAALKDPRGYQLDDRSRRALLANPVTSFERMGEVFLAAKRNRLAVEAFRAAAKQGQGNPATLGFNIARVHVETGKFQEALSELQIYFDKKQASKGRAAYQLLARILKGLKKSGELVGQLAGLDFTPHNPQEKHQTSNITRAIRHVLMPEVVALVRTLSEDDDGAFNLTEDSHIIWRTGTVGRLIAGQSILTPKIVPLTGEMVDGHMRNVVRSRLEKWLINHIDKHFLPLFKANEDRKSVV